MSFSAILKSLLDEGRMQFTGPNPVTAEDREAADEVLTEFEADYRLDWPADPPKFQLPVAVWAAEEFYLAAMALTYREIDETGVNEMLSSPCPGRQTAADHYAVDVVFRFLPDLLSRAKSASGNDPLVGHLMRWATEWPMSSVGIPDVTPPTIEPILNDESLTRMYLDRIFAKQDVARLNHPELKNLARAAYGMHEDLAREIAQAVTPTEDVEKVDS